ncbi:MAG: GDP-mannose 4,6-dehydratase [Anaerolineae bacterium]
MIILVTGAGGFVGQHLLRHLAATHPGAELHGAVIQPLDGQYVPASYHVLDLRSPAAVTELFQQLMPTHLYHLAAQANVARSYDLPLETLENNILVQVNVLEAVRALPKPPRTVIISSGEIYGTDHAGEQPLDENAPLRPSSPYGVSKVTQDMLGLQYYISYKLSIMRARPFNHLGPGQNLGFVAPDFAMQIARIEAGLQEPVMHVGSLSAERDFTDVRDIVRAYRLIMETGEAGQAYNVATGSTTSIKQVLDTLLQLSETPIEVRVDVNRIRPGSSHKSWGDSTRLRHTTGWEPEIRLEQTLKDVLDDCRQRVKGAGR